MKEFTTGIWADAIVKNWWKNPHKAVVSMSEAGTWSLQGWLWGREDGNKVEEKEDKLEPRSMSQNT